MPACTRHGGIPPLSSLPFSLLFTNFHMVRSCFTQCSCLWTGDIRKCQTKFHRLYSAKYPISTIKKIFGFNSSKTAAPLANP